MVFVKALQDLRRILVSSMRSFTDIEPSEAGKATNLNARKEANPKASVFIAHTRIWLYPIVSARRAWDAVDITSKIE